MQSPMPRHWRYAAIALAILAASVSVLTPVVYLASVSSPDAAVQDIRTAAQQAEAARRGRTVQRGGRGAAQPTRARTRTVTGLRRQIRSKAFGQGDITIPKALQQTIRQRAVLRSSVRRGIDAEKTAQ